jgi:hypothetical protein
MRGLIVSLMALSDGRALLIKNVFWKYGGEKLQVALQAK